MGKSLKFLKTRGPHGVIPPGSFQSQFEDQVGFYVYQMPGPCPPIQTRVQGRDTAARGHPGKQHGLVTQPPQTHTGQAPGTQTQLRFTRRGDAEIPDTYPWEPDLRRHTGGTRPPPPGTRHAGSSRAPSSRLCDLGQATGPGSQVSFFSF